jgi:hypothetical protein
MDELDDILRDDDTLSASATFAARVMEAVRAEAATPPPIPFPWRRLLIAPAVGLLLCVLTGAQAPDDMQLPTAALLLVLSRWANSVAAAPHAWAPAILAVGTLVGSLLIACLLRSLLSPPARLRHTAA